MSALAIILAMVGGTLLYLALYLLWVFDRRADMPTASNEQQRAEALIDLARARYPVEISSTDWHDAWPLIGHALLSRMTTNLQGIRELHSDRSWINATTLTRSLYEHVVHFAWLAVKAARKVTP